MKAQKRFFVFLLAAMLIVAALSSGCAAVPSATGSPAEAPVYEAPAAEEPVYEAYATEAPAAEQSQEEFVFNDAAAYTDDALAYDPSSEEYGSYTESGFFSPLENPLSTFSADVDTASYSQIRSYLNSGELPPADAVRIEECINYFSYDYSDPDGSDPVNVDVTISECPWNQERYLARVYMKARDMDMSEAPASNLVFLLDVSGSMDEPNKLPLIKSALSMLADELHSDDSVSIVVYAGSSGVVLDGCRGSDAFTIESALNQLSAGGSTAGGAGIDLAYDLAESNFIENGNNRVILCTDGDFNVGPSSTTELEDLIERKRSTGVFLSVLGFGTGNTKDNKMETLADKGNGNYAYIDTLTEAKKVLINESASTFFTVAKDVKIQIEFNPEAVAQYRLVGYDNRILNAQDFNNDRKDAGEMGAGHCVTAYYEIILEDTFADSGNVDDLVFQDNDTSPSLSQMSEDWMYVKLRYKLPDSSDSQIQTLMAGSDNYTAAPDNDFLFGSAVAEFAMLLKGSEFSGDADFGSLIERAHGARGTDEDGYRVQFLQLAELAMQLYR